MEQEVNKTMTQETACLEFLTIAETADILKVTRQTVGKLIRRDGLPAVPVGGVLRIPVTALKEWCRERYLGVVDVEDNNTAAR